MNQESPFESYLTDRADGIDVPGAGVGAIADRARQRRRRRRAGSAAVLGAAVLLGGAVVGQGLRADDAAEEVTSYGAAMGAPELDWTMVDVGDGLGWTRDVVRSESGTLYALSTAPGDSGATASYRPVVYTSVDGSEWSETTMADDVRVNGLAASGDTIYAVGTGAAGGAVKVASSPSPEDGWTVTDLPLDLEAESAGLPGRLYVAESDVATANGVTLVATTVMLKTDTEGLMAGEENPTEWYPERDGMVRWVCGSDGSSSASTTTVTLPPTSSVPGGDGQGDAAGAAVDDPAQEQAIFDAAGRDPQGGGCGESAREVRTWDELGVDPSVGDLVAGEVRLFAGSAEEAGSPDALTFQPVDSIPGAYGRELFATDAGFWSLGVAPVTDDETSEVVGERMEVRYSPDGFDWSAAPVHIDGAGVSVGLLDGAPHVLTLDWSRYSVQLHRLGAGSTTSLDLSDVVGLSEDRFYYAAEMGPLGIALVVGEGSGRYAVLHSSDGMTYGRTEVPAAEAGTKQSVNGITMSADAVKVRLNLYPAGDTSGGPPEAQRLFVGTPR